MSLKEQRERFNHAAEGVLTVRSLIRMASFAMSVGQFRTAATNAASLGLNIEPMLDALVPVVRMRLNRELRGCEGLERKTIYGFTDEEQRAAEAALHLVLQTRDEVVA